MSTIEERLDELLIDAQEGLFYRDSRESCDALRASIAADWQAMVDNNAMKERALEAILGIAATSAGHHSANIDLAQIERIARDALARVKGGNSEHD